MSAVGVLLMAYGTPRARDEIEAYYTDIRRGRRPTPEQLAELIGRYEAIGGLSPLVERTEAQRAALQGALDERAPGQFEVVLGMKHAAPTIESAVDSLAARGVRRIVGLVLAPHYSRFSVGEYLARAIDAAARHGIEVRGIEEWHLEPAYLDFEAAAVRAGLAGLPPDSKVLFTAHSLPQRTVATGDPYRDQVRATAGAVATQAGLAFWSGWTVAWQSAGRTPEPWIGPDLLTVIADLAASENASGVLVCACGFVADHLEVLYDLDIEAKRHAERLGLAFARTTCVNADTAVMDALAGAVQHAAAP
jgi:ferrochelatase